MHQVLNGIADYLLGCREAREVDPVEIAPPLLPHMFVLAVEPGAAARPVQLRIRLVGTAIDAAFHRPLKSRCLEEFIHGPRGADVIRAFHRCAETREPIWMRQVVQLANQSPRYVEGVAIYLPPERVYGGLVIGELSHDDQRMSFESASLR